MDLITTNNQTLVWTRSVAVWALLYDLTQARFRMQIRDAAGNLLVAFDSTNPPGDCSITYDPASKLVILRAELADAQRIAAGIYVYDLVMSVPVPSAATPFVKRLAGGAFTFAPAGVTR